MLTFENNGSKISNEHLSRKAYIYIRQSTYYQVENHVESKMRQYHFVQKARDLGWSESNIVIIDEDQGKSGAVADARSGFARLVAAVGRSEVGIVMSLEASRLSRNSPDWHTLIYICRFTGTLIADETGIFDPSCAADRLVLGIRGQMSEMELEMSIHRMIEGRWNKARRGELLYQPPAGYDLDDLNQLIITPDVAVAEAIRDVFAKFDELQSVKRVLLWWLEKRLTFPVRRIELKSHPIVWRTPDYRTFLFVLHHPIFAGAYVFGRSTLVREVDPDNPKKLRIRRIQVKKEQWKVLIKDHHPGYISFEKYEHNQNIIRSNQQMKRYEVDGHRGPAREGWALLQGLVRCGHCGRAMYVNYGGSRPNPKSTRTLQYRCSNKRNKLGGEECQNVAGKGINNVVVEEFLRVVRWAGEKATLIAAEQLSEEAEAAKRMWQHQIEKAEYEAQRAERQFNAVEPENRLVARTLEARWNARLAEVEQLRKQFKEACQERRPLSAQEKEKVRRLGNDLEAIWDAESTTNHDRKHLLRAAIDEVQLSTTAEDYQIKIIWKGGATTERALKRRRVGQHINATAEDTIEMIRKLAEELEDDQIARVLNKQGRRTGKGNAFTAHKVAMHRRNHGIAQCEKRVAKDPKEGPFTADEAAAELDVSSDTIHRWLRNGILPGKQIASGAPWRIILTEEVRNKLKGDQAPAGWLTLSQAAKALGLSRQAVAHLVKEGKLPAMRVQVGGRQCWKIDVSSASCGRQRGLFEHNQ